MHHSTCRECSRQQSGYWMNTKLVCIHCDELLFDIEIELEECTVPKREEKKEEAPSQSKRLGQT